MSDAFSRGADYLVRTNDDTEFTSNGWMSLAADVLQKYEPPNVGVVGPTCHQGNTIIMTHDMVHRTHLQIFPTYYPVVFHNWYIDDWISRVYGSTRTTKMRNWEVIHHTDLGTRYTAALNDASFLDGELLSGGSRINAFIKSSQLLRLNRTQI